MEKRVCREYWMIYRCSVFLAVVWFNSSPTPSSPPLPSVSSTSDTQEDWERETTFWREKGGGWVKSQIIRPQESLGLYESFNTLREYMYVCTEEFDLRWENCLSVLHTRHEPVFRQSRVIPKQSVQCRWWCITSPELGTERWKQSRINPRYLNLGFGPSF